MQSTDQTAELERLHQELREAQRELERLRRRNQQLEQEREETRRGLALLAARLEAPR